MTPRFILGILLALGTVNPLRSGDDELRREALARYGVGMWNALRGQQREAIAQLEQSVRQQPQSAAAHRDLARLYASVGRDAAAMRSARTALALDPADGESARLLGELLRDGRNDPEAVRAFRQAADAPGWNAPQRLNLLRELAEAADRAKDYAHAIRARQEIIALAATQTAELLKLSDRTPRDLHIIIARTYEQLGQSFIHTKQDAEARAAFESARDLYADDRRANLPTHVPRLHKNLADLHRSRGDDAAALRELDAYIRLVPPDFEVCHLVVTILREARQPHEIPARLRQFQMWKPAPAGLDWLVASEQLKANPRDQDAKARLLKLARAGGTAEQYQVLLEAFRASAAWRELLDLQDELAAESKRDSDRIPPYRRLMAAFRRHPPRAEELFPLLPERRKRESIEWIVELAAREKKTDEAAVHLQRAVTRGGTPDHCIALFNLYDQMKRWQEILRLAEFAKSQRDEFQNRLGLTPHYQSAHAYAELQDRERCLQEIDYIINNVVAKGQLTAQLEKARLLVLLGDYHDAQTICTDLAKNYRQPADQHRILLVQADLYDRRKEYAKAEETLRSLLEFDPDDALVLNNLGYHLADQGRKLEEAEEMIRRAIELNRAERRKSIPVEQWDYRSAVSEDESGTYLDSLGWVLFRRGKYAEARKVMEQASQSAESMYDAIVWDHLGDVYYKLKMKSEAKTAWTRAVELMKNSHHGREGGRLQEAKFKLTLVP